MAFTRSKRVSPAIEMLLMPMLSSSSSESLFWTKSRSNVRSPRRKMPPYQRKKTESGRKMAETMKVRQPLRRSCFRKLSQNSYLTKTAISGRTVRRKRRALRGVSAGR